MSLLTVDSYEIRRPVHGEHSKAGASYVVFVPTRRAAAHFVTLRQERFAPIGFYSNLAGEKNRSVTSLASLIAMPMYPQDQSVPSFLNPMLK